MFVHFVVIFQCTEASRLNINLNNLNNKCTFSKIVYLVYPFVDSVAIYVVECSKFGE